MNEGVLFEQEQGRHVWRLEATEWNGEQRLQVWPWFRPKEGGNLRPCSPRAFCFVRPTRLIGAERTRDDASVTKPVKNRPAAI